MPKFIIIVVLTTLLWKAESARILGIFPMPAPSHYMLGSSLLRALADKGHDVTMVSCFGEKTPPKNGSYRDIVLTDVYQSMQDRREEQNMFDHANSNPFLGMGFITVMMTELMESIISDGKFQSLIHSGQKFDVVIIEQFFNDGQKALAQHFGAQLIVFSTVGATSWVNSLVGNPSPWSYIPDVMLSYSSHMTFCERTINVLYGLFNIALQHLYIYPSQDKMIQKYIPNPPQLDQIMYNASLVLLNSHQSINQAVPYVPSMIDIGGFHIKPPKELPQDLKQFLDSAKDGVIYFSMGSNLRSSQLPPEKRDAFLKTFAKLKQKVLWKWEEDTLPGQPPNVKLSKWVPQQDLLAHPNVKLFITHGGLLSTTETIYHGVPVLAIPVFGDQKLNAKIAVNNEFGLTLPYEEIAEGKLTEAVHQLLEDPKYKTSARKRSAIFHDRLVSPMETAIYWVEYVARHKGAPHLRVAALDLPWYKYHLLDVFAFLATIGLASLVTFCYISKKILKVVCSKTCKKTSKKTKTN